MTKPVSTTILALISALLLFANSSRCEALDLQAEVLPPPVVPAPSIPAPFIPSPSDSVSPAWPTQKGIARVYRPSVIYRSHPLHRRRDLACLPTKEVVLYVKDPIRCCVAEICVCLPACCASPCLNSGSGVLGRAVVNYSWDCGVRVKVVFRHKGDPIVHYYGI